MENINIYIGTFEKAKKLSQILTPLPGSYELLQDSFLADARSILGIFSLDLSAPMILSYENDIPKEEFEEILKDYLTE